MVAAVTVERPEPAPAETDHVEAAAADEAPAATDDEVEAAATDEASAVHRLMERSKVLVASEQARVAEWLQENDDRPLLEVGVRIYERDRDSAGTVLGSALAFRLFLFFVPFLLFLVGLLGFVATFALDVAAEDVGLTGGMAEQINAALAQPNSTRWLATLGGLIGMMWAGRALSKGMVSASCLAWGLPVRAKASVRVVGGVVGLMAGVGLVATIVSRIRADLGIAVAGVSFLIAFGAYVLAWVVLSMLLPRATPDPGAVLPGAVVVGATLVGMQAISQLYLPDQFSRASQVYGAIGTTIVTLGWFFFLGRAIVLSMSVNAVIYERFGSISQFVFSLPVLRILPRRFEWIRRFFGLEE